MWDTPQRRSPLAASSPSSQPVVRRSRSVAAAPRTCPVPWPRAGQESGGASSGGAPQIFLAPCTPKCFRSDLDPGSLVGVVGLLSRKQPAIHLFRRFIDQPTLTHAKYNTGYMGRAGLQSNKLKTGKLENNLRKDFQTSYFA